MDIENLSGNISELVDLLRSEREAPVSLIDIASVTEVLIASMERYFATVNTSMYREIQDLADHIAKAKSDISRAQPNEIKSKRIPRAGKELSAIVQSTEGATHAIMEAAEEIMAAGSASGGGDSRAPIEDACMRIFEACSFQDVTGQRISKVVNTLTFIDERLDTLLEAYGGVTDSVPESKDRADPLLSGPQLEGEGITQDDVDSMFDKGEEPASPVPPHRIPLPAPCARPPRARTPRPRSTACSTEPWRRRRSRRLAWCPATPYKRPRRFPRGTRGNAVRSGGRRANAAAAPATVGGEPASVECHWVTGKAGRRAAIREPGDLPSKSSPSRWTGTASGADFRSGDESAAMSKRGSAGGFRLAHISLFSRPWGGPPVLALAWPRSCPDNPTDGAAPWSLAASPPASSPPALPTH